MEHIKQFKKNLNEQFGQAENITFDFFTVFSRFEFALKHTGYAKADNYRNALADWDRFAFDNENEFQKMLNEKKNKSLIEAANYLFNTPPKRLKLSAKNLTWETRPPIKNRTLKELILVIRGVRNNLFHGSKQLAISEESRNHNLLNYGLLILNECLNIDKKLRKKFIEELL